LRFALDLPAFEEFHVTRSTRVRAFARVALRTAKRIRANGKTSAMTHLRPRVIAFARQAHRRDRAREVLLFRGAIFIAPALRARVS
jgi:hypothetical protein